MMIVLVLWFLGAAIVAAIAKNKDRGAVGFFLVSLFLSPFIGLIAVLLSQPGGKKCPTCAEQVKFEALKCRHCGHQFPPNPVYVK